jgi:hypothetical protein
VFIVGHGMVDVLKDACMFEVRWLYSWISLGKTSCVPDMFSKWWLHSCTLYVNRLVVVFSDMCRE